VAAQYFRPDTHSWNMVKTPAILLMLLNVVRTQIHDTTNEPSL